MPAEGDKDKEASLDRLIDDKVAAVLAANDQQVLEAAPGSPKKGIPKNILLYSDRKRELEKSPELCLNHHSPTRPIVKAEASIIDDIKREKGIIIDANSNKKRLKEEKTGLIETDSKYFETEKLSNEELENAKNKLKEEQ